MEDGRWITINGAHVFIKEGQHPMDAFIKQKGGKKTNENKKGAINNIEKIEGYKIEEEIGKYDEVIGHTFKVKTKDGFITLGIRETDNEIYLNNIVTKSATGQRLAEKGTGTKILNNMKQYADKTGKDFIVAGIVKPAEPFYDKFEWLKKEKINIYDDFGELFDDSDVNRIYKPKK